MNYWWVNHKQTFRSEVDGGYIWSPKADVNGAANQTYDNLTRVSVGDVVFSYANAAIQAIGIVASVYREQAKPSEFKKAGDKWSPTGWLVPIEWQLLSNPIVPKDYIGELARLLPEKYSPLQSNGNGNQKFYLTLISNKLANFLLEIAKHNSAEEVDFIAELQEEVLADEQQHIIDNLNLDETEKEQLIKARKGQGKFRLNVAKLEKQCRITHIFNKNFLTASHIKPWKDCSNEERLDGNNGLLLSPHVDKLFDKGWISFDNNGNILVANKDASEAMATWGLNKRENVGPFNSAQKRYLGFHRQFVYKAAEKGHS